MFRHFVFLGAQRRDVFMKNWQCYIRLSSFQKHWKAWGLKEKSEELFCTESLLIHVIRSFDNSQVIVGISKMNHLILRFGSAFLLYPRHPKTTMEKKVNFHG